MMNLEYLYDKDKPKSFLEGDFFVDKAPGFQIISHGTILPHIKDPKDRKHWWGTYGIIDDKGNFYRELKPTTPPILLDKEIKSSPKTVVHLGLITRLWGHDITINLSRLWFLHSEVFKKEFKNCPVVYSPWFKGTADKGIKKYLHVTEKKNFPRLLEILEIDPNALQPIEELTQFENVIFPDASIYFGRGLNLQFTEEYRQMIERLRTFALKNRTPTAKKVYYFYGQHQTGEELLAEYFKSKGYEIISPEKFSLDEQLNFLINCESFASTLGSCAHNSIFLRDGTEAIFIPRAANSFTYYQRSLQQVNSLDANYVDSSLSIFNRNVPRSFANFINSSCYVISNQLRRFFGEKISGFTKSDFETFLSYVKKNCNPKVNMYDIINPTVQTYYENILPDFMEQLKAQKDLITAYNLPPNWEEILRK